MNDISFFSDWIFYGSIAALIGIGLTTYWYAKKIGADKVTWKHMAIILAIFVFPSMILPLLLAPFLSLLEKVGVTVAIVLFGAVRYYATTKGQEAMAELRKRKKKENEKSDGE